jgi:hypothetical protein
VEGSLFLCHDRHEKNRGKKFNTCHLQMVISLSPVRRKGIAVLTAGTQCSSPHHRGMPTTTQPKRQYAYPNIRVLHEEISLFLLMQLQTITNTLGN